MSRHCILRRPTHLIDARIEDDLLVLDPASGHLHTLSHSAGLIFAAADGTSTSDGIAATLSARLELPADQVADDVGRAVTTMLDEGLLIADDPSSDAAGLPRLHVGPACESNAWVPRPAVGPLTDFGPKLAGASVVRVTSSVPAVDALLHEPLGLLPLAERASRAEAVISVTDPGDGGPFEIREDNVPVASAFSADDAAEAVLAACNRVTTTAPAAAVRIHGGVSASGDRAVVVCGESGTGKSSLTAALVQNGWRYLTDEVAVIDPLTRAVTPYPKWVDLSMDSLRLLGLDESLGIGPAGPKHHVPPELLGAVGGAATVEAIVLLTGSRDASSEVRELGLRDAVPALLGNVFATTWEHPHGLQAVVGLCAATTVVQVPRRPLDEMVAVVEALVE